MRTASLLALVPGLAADATDPAVEAAVLPLLSLAKAKGTEAGSWVGSAVMVAVGARSVVSMAGVGGGALGPAPGRRFDVPHRCGHR